MREWQPIETAPNECWPGDDSQVDLWLKIGAAPSTFGWADAFRVTDCWRKNDPKPFQGPWVHMHAGVEKELRQDCITHWMSKPRPPGAS